MDNNFKIKRTIKQMQPVGLDVLEDSEFTNHRVVEVKPSMIPLLILTLEDQ